MVDDILIEAPDYDVLFTRLEAVLKRCDEFNIVLSLSKLALGEKVPFSGFTVSAQGVLPSTEREWKLHNLLLFRLIVISPQKGICIAFYVLTKSCKMNQFECSLFIFKNVNRYYYWSYWYINPLSFAYKKVMLPIINFKLCVDQRRN